MLYVNERTRVDKAHIWPQILRKVTNLYYINTFLITGGPHARVHDGMF